MNSYSQVKYFRLCCTFLKNPFVPLGIFITKGREKNLFPTKSPFPQAQKRGGKEIKTHFLETDSLFSHLCLTHTAEEKLLFFPAREKSQKSKGHIKIKLDISAGQRTEKRMEKIGLSGVKYFFFTWWKLSEREKIVRFSQAEIYIGCLEEYERWFYSARMDELTDQGHISLQRFLVNFSYIVMVLLAVGCYHLSLLLLFFLRLSH